MEQLNIKVEKREATGKNANRRLRSEGLVPAVLYGGDKEAVSIQLSQRKMDRLLRSEGGDHAVFKLELEGSGKSRHAMIRDLQSDPLTGKTLHVDFFRIDLDQEVHVTIPIELAGTPKGVKNEGGFLDFVTREVEVVCKAVDIPGHLTVDVSGLGIGDHIEASQLELPDGVVLTEDDAEKVIASVAHIRIEEVEEEEDEDALLETVAEEPEVIGKGKEDEGEDEES